LQWQVGLLFVKMLYSAAPQAEQKREPTGLVWRQRKQASCVPGCGAGGTFTVTLNG
jgi:hypothetical protein